MNPPRSKRAIMSDETPKSELKAYGPGWQNHPRHHPPGTVPAVPEIPEDPMTPERRKELLELHQRVLEKRRAEMARAGLPTRSAGSCGIPKAITQEELEAIRVEADKNRVSDPERERDYLERQAYLERRRIESAREDWIARAGIPTKLAEEICGPKAITADRARAGF
jgi:hypothetical protein